MANGTQSNSGTVGAEQAQLSPPPRILPIIVIPGIMGTRLKDPVTGALAWNPMGRPVGRGPGRLAGNSTRLSDIGAPLVPDDVAVRPSQAEVEAIERQHGVQSSEAQQARLLHDVPHALNVVSEFYGGLVDILRYRLPALLRPRGYTPQVYCCGYDWRQSNHQSAHRLQTVVNEARVASGNEQVILIAHSMGGIVSRYYMRAYNGAPNVRALFLLASPSLGAPESYVFMKKGIADTLTRWMATGTDEAGSRDYCRRVPSIYQLLPSPTYCAHADPAFAQFREAGTAYSATGPLAQGPTFRDASDFSRFYEDIYTGLQDTINQRALCTTHFQLARNVHTVLGGRGDAPTWMPQNTYSAYGDQLRTVTGATIPFYRAVHYPFGNMVETLEIQERSANAGDGSVPTISANPPASHLSTQFHEPAGPMHGVGHRDFCNNGDVHRYLLDRIPGLLPH